jgi:hypothetical protein
MDTFVEQLVSIKQTSKTITLKIAIWAVAALLAAGFVVMSFLFNEFAAITLLLAALSFYLAYTLSTKLNQEFEYINTNGEIDIDRIINKNKRERMATFLCNEIENIEHYDQAHHKSNQKYGKDVYFACTPDSDSIALTIKHPKKGSYILIFSPNDDFMDSLKKFLPYTLKKNL